MVKKGLSRLELNWILEDSDLYDSDYSLYDESNELEESSGDSNYDDNGVASERNALRLIYVS